MKELYFDIKQHVKSDFNKIAYLYILIFVTISIFTNYYFDIQSKFINPFYGKPIGIVVYIVFYAFSYYAALIPFLLIKKQKKKLKSTEFWVKSISFIFVAGFASGYYSTMTIAKSLTDNTSDYFFLAKILSNFKRTIFYIIVIYIIKLIYDRNLNHFYGLRFSGLNYRPFFFLLIIMALLAGIASFTPSFQESYPQFKYWNYDSAFGLSKSSMTIIYEFSYGLDFVCVEMLFRGALIVGMISVLGKESVIPMAVFYVFIHFGKPAGETISSFFGGYILGVIALNKRNIIAGVLIHLGLAYFMEIFAIIQHVFSQK